MTERPYGPSPGLQCGSFRFGHFGVEVMTTTIAFTGGWQKSRPGRLPASTWLFLDSEQEMSQCREANEMLAFCPFVSLVSYWTNSQLQTNEASGERLVESAKCHTLSPHVWRLETHGWKRFQGSYLCVLYRLWRVVTESLHKLSELPSSFSLCGTELFLALFVFSRKPNSSVPSVEIMIM